MGADPIELVAGGDRAVVSLMGAECRAWSVGGTPLLWTPDARYWDAVAPVLFPVCGWTRHGEVRIGGRTFPLGLHGFARTQQFSVARQDAASVMLRLKESEETRTSYPFFFELDVSYRLSAGTLEVEGCVRNTGPTDMPYSFGLHPGFRWPPKGSAKDQWTIVFAAEEKAEVPVIAPGGLFSDRRRPIPLSDRELPLCDELFAKEALCFLDAASRELTLQGPAGSLHLAMENFPHVVLWSRPGAPFLCIESWTGYGDPEGYEGDLFSKPSMIILPPGEERRHVVRYRFTS